MADGERQRGANGRFLPRGGVVPGNVVELGSWVGRAHPRPLPPAGGEQKGASLPQAGGERKKGSRRLVRWSLKREERFLAKLGESCNVAASIRASGLSESNVYRMRRKSADFAAKWLGALREGYFRVESAMLDRIINGVVKPVFFGGKQIGEIIEYDDRSALALLKLHRETVMGKAAPTSEEEAEIPIEERRARLKARLSAMNKRMGGKG